MLTVLELEIAGWIKRKNPRKGTKEKENKNGIFKIQKKNHSPFSI